ncbi:urea amidolyase associated protein UAAP1, partial [Type-D symbiont of Plautia stali]|uniref:urea amidolyase associated protein UAAP1 n=1 Tax=Type-D symbiont of Plautia stali TaxID=1560356 RepID=UPI00073E1CC3
MNAYQTLLPAGSHWSLVMRSGTALTLTDIEGGANVGLLFYNPENLLERYNAPDTLKCQHTFRLTAGHCLYSDMGRIFCGIEQDSFGWHETVCGTLNAQQTAARFGVSDYQEARNLRHQNGYDSFLIELAKYGLGQRDMAACLNLFAQVRADDNGTLKLEKQGAPGASVRLRFAMDTLV